MLVSLVAGPKRAVSETPVETDWLRKVHRDFKKGTIDESVRDTGIHPAYIRAHAHTVRLVCATLLPW